MDKLQISDIRKTLNFNISTGVSMELREFVLNEYGDTIDFDVYLPSIDKNLQRPFCWNLEQKQELIFSVIKGIEISNIAVVITKRRETNSLLIEVIDGKQRISTLIAFCKGEFPITVNGKDYFFNDLDEKVQYIFNSFTFKSNRAYNNPETLITDADKLDWFEMINFAGVPQDAQHIKNLRS